MERPSRWYVGTGLMVAKPTAIFTGVPVDAPGTEVSPTVFAGLTLRVGPIRPLVEGHLIDLLSFSGLRGLVFSGVGGGHSRSACSVPRWFRRRWNGFQPHP